MRSKHIARCTIFVAAVLSAVPLMAPLAQAATPKPGYTQFTGCPSPSEDPAVEACLHSVVSGGHFQMGSKDVPITNPIVLNGGLKEGSKIVANAEGGLLPAKQKVPGGVIGLTGLAWLAEFLGVKALTLYAVTEIAGQPTLSTNLSLPIKIHLINPVLGSNCYVGSVSDPIQLELTVETTDPPPPNEPISGKSPAFSFDPMTGIIHQKSGTFVDNSFAAPGANGCVLNLFGFIPIGLNGLVNLQSGLPSPAGTNETIQHFDNELAAPSTVYSP